MSLKSCEFETDRLWVRPWHSRNWPRQLLGELTQAVAAILTQAVSRTLPDEWHGDFTPERARDWIRERDREATTLLIVEKASRSPVGLLLLYEEDSDDATQVRLGYLLAESWWGRGFATEAIEGLVQWCRVEPRLASLIAGVASDNQASKRVLEKSGFSRDPDSGTIENDETYRLVLRPVTP